VRIVELKHGQWQSDFVVKIAGISQGAETLAQYRPGQLLGGALADAASDTHHARVQFGPPVSRQLLQCLEAVSNFQADRKNQGIGKHGINCWFFSSLLFNIQDLTNGCRSSMYQGSDRAAAEGIGHIVVPIHFLSGQSYEQRARDCLARINGNLTDGLSLSRCPSMFC
jgi:hypothetical protein